jgi:ribosomal protein S6--L-glutamate ligase
MKAALISLGSVSSKWTLQAMKNYFSEVDDLDIRKIEINFATKTPSVFYDGKPMKAYDCVYAKGSFRYAQLLRSITTFYREDPTYMPIEAEAYTIVHDKLLTQLMLQENGIPMPKTYLSSTPMAAKKILENINYPIIMKFPQGTQGKGVMFADSFASASSMLDALTALKQPFLIQEYIETDETDTRAFVIGNKVVAGMKRKAMNGEKRANIHAGATGENAELDAYTKKIAVQTAKVLGAEICAVDILESVKGPLIIEANVSPGLQEITKVTKVNIADKIARFLAKKTKEMLDRKKSFGASDILREIDSKGGEEKKLITNPDFRGNRILLPEMVTNITKFVDEDHLEFEIKKGKLTIKRIDIGSK